MQYATNRLLRNVLEWAIAAKIVRQGASWKVPPKRKLLTDMELSVLIQAAYPDLSSVVVIQKVLPTIGEYLTEQAWIDRRNRKREALLSETEFYQDELEFVNTVLPSFGVEVTPGGLLRGENASKIESLLLWKAMEYNRTITKEMKEAGIHTLDKATIAPALASFVATRAAEIKSKVTERIGFDDQADPFMSSLHQYVRAIRSPSAPEESYELDFHAMHHMLWQVKRRFFGMKADPILATFLYGFQNTGKSTALRMLFSPIEEFTFEADINNAIDVRWNFIAQQYFILNVEELLGMQKADIEKLKSFVTKDVQVTRLLGSHQGAMTKQNLSIFGSTNRSIDSLIGDETGMRRWYQIICPQYGERMDYDSLNCIDYTTIWKSIDEDMDQSPLFSHPHLVDQLAALQESWRRHTDTETFLRSTGLWPLECGGEMQEISLDTIMLKMGAWAETNGMKLPDRRRVIHQLQGLHVPTSGQGRALKYMLAQPETRARAARGDDFSELSIPLHMEPIN